MTKRQGANPSLTLRVPAQLREMLEQAADDKGRSLNAEAIARLWESFEQPPSALSDRVGELEKKVIELEKALHALTEEIQVMREKI